MKLLYAIIGCSGIMLPLQAQTPTTSTRPVATAVVAPAAYTGTVNYIRVWEPGIPSTDVTDVMAASHTTKEVKQMTQYFDGLGRILQTVTKGISGTADINATDGKDMVVPVVYDGQGREQYKYLPYVQQTANTNDGKFKTNPFSAQAAFYQNTTLNPGLSGESIYYQQAEFEASPMNRLLQTFAPGNSWAKEGGSRPVKNQYLVNALTDTVYIWTMPATGDVPSMTGAYAAGELYKNIVIDEAGSQLVEYKDKEDHVVLKKVQLSPTPGPAHMGWLCTYYVYDNAGKLRFVMPPKAVDVIKGKWTIAPDVAAELCFIYQYDNRDRLMRSKIPGADEVEMVYDVRDRMVFRRDGQEKTQGVWEAIFYDALNRDIMTALYASSATQAALQAGMNTALTNSAGISYTFPGIADLVLTTYDGKTAYQATNSILLQSGFETAGSTDITFEISSSANQGTQTLNVTNPLPGVAASALTPLTYTYYDNYIYSGKLDYVAGDISKPQAGTNPNPEVLPSAPSSMTQGLETGIRLRILNSNDWITTSIYYNDKGREVQTVASNIAGGRNVFTSLYDFKGNVLSTYLRHTNQHSVTNPETRILTMNQYDHANRLVSVKTQLNDDASLQRTVAENTYDELGRMKTKRLGVTGTATQMESLAYEYNIRGWLQGINKGFVNGGSGNWFGQELNYDDGFSTNQYNGNIAGIKWKSGSNNQVNAYGYSYDKANRLTIADFRQLTGSTWSNSTVDFSVNGLSYDPNGNIYTMNQAGMIGVGTAPVSIDQLTYTYKDNSNKLLTVDDKMNNTADAKLGDFIKRNNSGQDYQYNNNGNLTQDLNKGIGTISYNHLNLPESIVFTDKGTVNYIYDATGNKLRKTVTEKSGSDVYTTVTDYMNGFEYRNDSLKFFGHEEGRVRTVFKASSPVSYAFDYFIRDHLGNVRTVLTDQTDFSMYVATMETENAAVETALFSNVESSRIATPASYPKTQDTSVRNAFVAKLNGSAGGKKIGPSLVLRVMAGDTVRLGTRAFYPSQGPKDNKHPNLAEDMVAGLVQAFSGNSADKTHGAAVVNNTPFNTDFYNNQYEGLKKRDAQQNMENKPKAYLNYVAFDDQFNMVQQNSGLKQVKGEADELQTLNVDKMVMKESGFLYVYTSNETQQDVYFDNLTVNLTNGPLLEDTHYYPFGLTMSGISSNALKGTIYPENKVKFNGIEFNRDLDVNTYEANFRNLDPQLGRWWQVDPKPSDMISPYAAMDNNPIRYADTKGDTIFDADILKSKVWGEAYKVWAASKQGQAFKKLFGAGGKFGKINVTFAAVDLGYRSGNTKAYLGDKTTGKKEEMKDEVTYKGIQKLAQGGLDPKSSLSFVIRMNENETNVGLENAEAILHETQHVRLDRQALAAKGKMDKASYQHLDLMKNKELEWYKERFDFYNDPAHRKYWLPEYQDRIKNSLHKNETVPQFINYKIQDFIN